MLLHCLCYFPLSLYLSGAIVLSVAMVAVAMVIVVIVVATVTGAMPILGNKCTKAMRISETHFCPVDCCLHKVRVFSEKLLTFLPPSFVINVSVVVF